MSKLKHIVYKTGHILFNGKVYPESRFPSVMKKRAEALSESMKQVKCDDSK